jgi:predicted adenylyl cyclase CyaB
MKEIEVKILEISHAKIEETLTKLQAQKTFDDTIQTIFLDFKDASITKHGNLLRLRRSAQKTELTFKKVRHTQTVKIAEEYSIEVSDIDKMLVILKNLGLLVTGNVEKQRVSYRLEDAQFDIDRYLGEFGFIPEFLEIEAEDIGHIHKYAELLGFKPEECLPWSTEDLIQHYSNIKQNPH